VLLEDLDGARISQGMGSRDSVVVEALYTTSRKVPGSRPDKVAEFL
jgi:hypothetical protein